MTLIIYNLCKKDFFLTLGLFLQVRRMSYQKTKLSPWPDVLVLLDFYQVYIVLQSLKLISRPFENLRQFQSSSIESYY